LLFASPLVTAEDAWVGETVMPKKGAVLKIGSRTIADGEAVYIVKEVRDDWLWTGTGWIRSHDVVLLADAPDYFSGLIRENPGDDWAYNMRGVAWTNQGGYQNAIRDFSAAIRLGRNDAGSYANRGAAHVQQGDYRQAIADLTRALQLQPDQAAAYSNRGVAWQQQGDLDAALRDFTEAVRLNPAYAAAYSNRGECWERQGEYERALNDYTEAIRIDSQFASPYALRARLWATCPAAEHRDGEAAVKSAMAACELTSWKNALCLDTLAAAYAETGDFAEAARWQEKATELATGESREAFEERLKLYRDEKPYRAAREA
jgi:tetratricopeptide (TPR) repeat protein